MNAVTDTPVRSCLNCAYRLGGFEQGERSDYSGTSAPQVDACARFDQVLGAISGPGQLTGVDGRRIAKDCKAYLGPATVTDTEGAVPALATQRGKRPGALGHWGGPLHLTLPLEVKAPERPEDGPPPTCSRCVYYCAPAEIKEHGLPTVSKQGRGAGMCVAHGTLQDAGPGACKQIARECPEFTPEEPGWDAPGEDKAMAYREELLTRAQYPAHLMPLLADTIVGSSVELEAQREALAKAAKQVRTPTDDERADGITAFRRFFSDDETRWVDLPVFDPDHFEPAERAKIPVAGTEGAPEVYVDHANLGYRVAVAWVLGETPALNGPAGVGKTMLFQWLAYELGLPFERVSITASSSVDDLAGYMELHSGQTEFVLGRIPKAWAKPCVMVIDEPNAGPPEVWQFIRPITDSAKQLVIDANHGQKITRHPYSFLGMAMNPAWDWRNTGVAPLADADGSRLLHIAVDYPSQEDERQIILSHCAASSITVNDAELDALLTVAASLRKLSREQTLQVSWGIRQQVQVARLLPYFEFVDAFRMAVTDYLEPEQADLVLAEVNMVTAGLGKGKKKAKR